ncbi:MAG: hypothetical protein Q9227_003701 [Pyrenula ochraceoflavens]
MTQSRLRFQPLSSSALSTPDPDLSRASTASSETLLCPADADTIVVGRPSLSTQQLPTPSESSSDIAEKTLGVKKTSHLLAQSATPETEGDRARYNGKKLENATPKGSRNVSGETLITDTPRANLLQDGISALDLQWNMSSVFKRLAGNEEGQGSDLSTSQQTEDNDSASHAETKAERAARIRVKQEQNEATRLARIKAADAKATRRSSRVSMLDKAGDTVSDMASSVLGKRSRDIFERGKDALGELKRRASLRPRGNTVDSATSSFEGPTTKMRRTSDDETAKAEDGKASEAAVVPNPAKRSTKNKRFLTSGLYVGQTRPVPKKKAKSAQETPLLESRLMPLPLFAGDRLLTQGRDFKLPFSIFSPLPSGQPKPDEWKKTNKNVFVGDAGSFWRTSKKLEHSTCMCTAETGCDEDCQNRFMFYECDSTNCNLPPEKCGNRSFEELRQRVKKGTKYSIGVEVIKTEDRGYGVRSNRSFEPNQIIVEYTGEIITQDECEARMRDRYKDNECYYLMLFDQNMIIDATRGSIARFVNHSCVPNCRMEKWTVAGKPRMALFAGERGIITGEELTYDYNFDPFSRKNVQECRCGEKGCRGVLGPRERKGGKEEGGGGSTMKGIVKKGIEKVLDEGKGLITGNKKRKAAATATEEEESGPVRKAAKSRPSSIRSSIREMTTTETKTNVSRRSSMLKKVLEVSNKTTTTISARRRAGSRVEKAEQGEEENEVLLSPGKETPGRNGSVRKNVVRTVRGRQSGQMRTIRALDTADEG